jgi:serine/threonine protein phosphatase 1
MSASSTVFATLRRARRIWAVAAIHGEADKLGGLHDKLADALQTGDRIVYLGNYLGHGPAVGATLDQLVDFRRWVIAQPSMFAKDVVFLRGCQEEMWHKLLQLQFAITPTEVMRWTLDQGVGATLAAYGASEKEALSIARQGPVGITRWTLKLRQAMNQSPGHAEFMAALKRAAFTEDGRLLFVSAGLDPSLPLAAQIDSFWWGSAGFATLESDDAAPYEGYVRVVRGFARERSANGHGRQRAAGSNAAPITLAGVTATVDGGAGFGGVLAAACFDPAGELVDRIET